MMVWILWLNVSYSLWKKFTAILLNLKDVFFSIVLWRLREHVKEMNPLKLRRQKKKMKFWSKNTQTSAFVLAKNAFVRKSFLLLVNGKLELTSLSLSSLTLTCFFSSKPLAVSVCDLPETTFPCCTSHLKKKSQNMFTFHWQLRPGQNLIPLDFPLTCSSWWCSLPNFNTTSISYRFDDDEHWTIHTLNSW